MVSAHSLAQIGSTLTRGARTDADDRQHRQYVVHGKNRRRIARYQVDPARDLEAGRSQLADGTGLLELLAPAEQQSLTLGVGRIDLLALAVDECIDGWKADPCASFERCLLEPTDRHLRLGAMDPSLSPYRTRVLDRDAHQPRDLVLIVPLVAGADLDLVEGRYTALPFPGRLDLG